MPREIVESLGDLLSFRHYEPIGSAHFMVREGEQIRGEIGGHRLSFHAGTVLLDQRLRLRSFELAKRSGESVQRLFRADVNLKNDKALLLTISSDRRSESGMVVALRWRPAGRVSPPQPGN